MGFVFKAVKSVFKSVGDLFSPSMPSMPGQKIDKTDTAAIEAAAEQTRRRERMAAGRAATMLTSSATSSPTVGRRTLG